MELSPKTTTLKSRKKARIRYTVIVDIDEENDTNDFHDRIVSGMSKVFQGRKDCTIIIGETDEFFTVTRMDRLL